MANNTLENLGEPFDSFVEREISAGRFETREDVVRAGLGLLEQQERRRERLRQALQDGLDSGEAREFDFDELFDDGEFDMVTGERRSA